LGIVYENLDKNEEIIEKAEELGSELKIKEEEAI